MKKYFNVLFTLTIILLSISIYAGATTLNYLEVMTSPERTTLLKEMIKEYESTHPGIKINLISPPYEQADQKATLMLNTNQALDIIEVRDYTIKQFVNNKKLLDLTQYYEEWADAETLTPVAMKAAKSVDNTPYIVPQCIFIKALFVREDVLAKYGINYTPKTFSELIEISRQITNPNRNQYGFAWRGKSNEFKFADLFASAYVDDIKDANYIYSEDKSFFADPRYKLGMETYIELFKQGVPKDGINWGFNEQINAFVSGTTPFLIQDPDAIPLINKLLGKDKYKVVPLPVGPYGITYMDYGFTGLGIPSYSKHKEEAWDFIKWISSSEKNGYFNEHYGALPVQTTTFKESSYFMDAQYQAFNYEMSNTDKYIFKAYPIDSQKWPGWSQIHEVDIQGLLLGKTDLDTVLTKWENYWK